MEMEISVQDYINVMLKRWKVIIAVFLGALVVSVVVSFRLPPIYEAIVTLVVTQSKYVAQFDPRLETVEIEPRYEAFSSLAKTAELEERVMAALEEETDGELNVGDLQGMATVSYGDDPSVIFLKVRHWDPGMATLVANTWARLYVAQVTEIYGRTQVEETRLQVQLREGEENLTAADEALVEFEAQSRIPMLENELEAKSRALASYLRLREQLQLLVEDAESLRDRLAFEASEGLTLGENLSILLLEVGTLSYGPAEGYLPGLELSLDESAFDEMSREGQRQVLNSLISSLTDREEPISAAIQSLSLELPALQAELQEQLAKRQRLQLDRDLAEETYRALSRKVDEARVVMDVDAGVVSIASQAYEPSRPVPTSKILNVAVAAMVGLFVGIMLAFGLEYVRGSDGSSAA